MLEKPRLLDCLVLTPPTRKMQRNWNTMVVFLFMYLFAITVQVIMTFPHLPTWSIMLNLVLTTVSLVCLMILTVKQPGRLKPQTINFMTMLATLDCTQLCPECEILRTSRSRHCTICGYCVERFDHHCPWINNCVGVNNHTSFYIFITDIFLTLLTIFAQSFHLLILFFNTTGGQIPLSNFGHLLEVDPRRSFFLPSIAVLLAFTFFFLMPVGYLVLIQTGNFFKGKTTSERFSKSALAQSDDNFHRFLNSGIKNDRLILTETKYSLISDSSLPRR